MLTTKRFIEGNLVMSSYCIVPKTDIMNVMNNCKTDFDCTFCGFKRCFRPLLLNLIFESRNGEHVIYCHS